MKIPIHKILLFLVLSSYGAYSQNNTIDSLQKVLLIQKEDTNKVNTLNYLTGSFFANGNYENAMRCAKQALSLSERIKFKKGKGTAYNHIGLFYALRSNFPEALKNCFIALKIMKEIGDKTGISACYDIIVLTYQAQENYPEAIKYSYFKLAIDEETGDKIGMGAMLHKIGSFYSFLHNDYEALKNYQASFKIFEKLGRKEEIASAAIGLGDAYFNLSNYAEALKNDSIALKFFKDLEINWGQGWAYRNIGKVYAKLGEMVFIKRDKANAANKFAEAEKNYLTYLKISNANKDTVSIADAYLNLGKLYIKLNNLSVAKDYLEKSLQLYKTVKLFTTEGLSDNYNALSTLDSIQGNYKQAYEHYRLHILYRDSLANAENAKKFLQSKMQYESDKKEVVAKAEQEKRDYEQKRVRDIQYFAIGSLIILVLITLLIAFIQWRNNKQKKKANGLLAQQKEKIETTLAELKATQEQLIQVEKKQAVSNERLRISRELHDEVGATLSSISIFSQAAIQKNESGNMADSKNILERIGETSRDVMGELNDAVWLINPLNDNLQKIIQRISNYALPLCRTNNIYFEIKATASLENLALSVEKRKAIYLIIKEAINNSLKYAAAKNLTIQFEKNHNALHISIKDDGVGCVENNSSSGNGLNNMKQRANDVNGKIDFDSVPQKGTEITLQVPLTNIGD